MIMAFVKATKAQSKLRLALIGPAGSGKTFSALSIAKGLGKRVALLCSEHGSAAKYADRFDFDIVVPTTFAPSVYVQAIRDAEDGAYDVIILDGLSAAWSGRGGLLEQVDQTAKRGGSGSFGAWRDATPQHHNLIDAILSAKVHVIATMRTKMEHVQERDEKTGKTVVRKVGMQPVQRDGLEYEFDVVGDMNQEHELIVSKSRCPEVTDAIIPRPGAELGSALRAWLTDGVALATDEQRQAIKARLLMLREKGSTTTVAGIVGHEGRITSEEALRVLAVLDAKLETSARAAASPAPVEPEPIERHQPAPGPDPVEQARADLEAATGEPAPKRKCEARPPATLAALRKSIDREMDRLGVYNVDDARVRLCALIGHTDPPSFEELRDALSVLEETVGDE